MDSAMVNKVMLIGVVTSEIKQVETKTGVSMALLTVNTKHRKNDEEKNCFHSVVCFGKVADTMIKYAKKGSKVWVEGRLEYSPTKENPEFFRAQVNAFDIHFVGDKNAA